MKSWVNDSDIRFYANVATSVTELGHFLDCSGCQGNKRNLNGRDLRRIRKVLGLKKYARLSGNKLHGGRSFYAKLYEISKKDKEVRAIANRNIKQSGIIRDALIENTVDSYIEQTKR